MHLPRSAAVAAAAMLLASPALAAAQAPEAATGAPPPPAAAPAAPAPSVPPVQPGPNIYATLKDAGQFTTLLKAVDQAGLTAVLQQYGSLTFFAPTDAAFASLPPDVLSKLMANNDASANQLQQILKYHLINALVDNSKIKGAKGPVPTVEGTSVDVDGSNPDDLLVNKAQIVQEVRAANGGIVNVIDKVLIPTDSPFFAQLGGSASNAPATVAPAS
jgi:uncharacterized surface protein with fasciclin (FAS1) repeats